MWLPTSSPAVVTKLSRSGRAVSDLGQMVLLCRGKPLATGVALFLETVFPRPEILRQVFADAPDVSACRLYARRVGQLLRVMRPHDFGT